MNNRVLINFGIFICLLLPKFNIVNIKGFAQGIRYDDIFLLFCLIIIIINNKLALSIFPNKSLYFFFYIYLIFYGLISYYTTNSYAIILPLRWIEYSVFYMIIARLKMSLKEIRYMIIGYIIFNVIFVYLQYIHVLGGIYSHGYISDVSTRIS